MIPMLYWVYQTPQSGGRRVVDMNEELKLTKQLEKKKQSEKKKQVNKVITGVLLYELITVVCVMLDALIQMIRVAVLYRNSPDMEQQVEAVLEDCINSGRGMILSIAAGLFFLFIYFRKQEYSKKIFNQSRSMKRAEFFPILTVFMALQVFFLVVGNGAESILNRFGFSLMEEIESATSASTVFSMFLYVSFIAPIAEELVFRGFVMRGLERFGKITAISGSALLFGAIHGNLIQGVFAAMAGLVLGYVAMEYSILWSIVIHIINNFIFGDLWAYVTGGLNETLQDILFYGVYGCFFVAAGIELYLKRNEIKEYWRKNKNKNGHWKIIVTSFWFILFMILQLAVGISGIHKI